MKFFGAIISLMFSTAAIAANPWEKFTEPATGPASSIGSYANGCLVGGEALPLEGDGYQVIRTSRERYYANPVMVDYLVELAKENKRLGHGDLLIGDMSMARGGRFTSGHASHQTGLDADIWLRIGDKQYSRKAREKLSPYNVVDMKNYKIKAQKWTDEHAKMVELAATDKRVARIFVHPVIKETLCKAEWPNGRDWLRKVRPWFGHNYHMHVRLNCPKGDDSCTAQLPPPPGDGCGKELYSWWPKPKTEQEKAKEQEQLLLAKSTTKTKPKKPVYKDNLKLKPLRCQDLINGTLK
ncbi:MULTISPECIES: penicillin-insensitive murein endopeptidase [unclassified Motilimonas]|uniref:penicillin-insensitive murein endopeptidase n=1 Tax=unclassified Motilimonas TaxID=2643697 RepID=UPI001E611C39|nr:MULTISPECIES: penicillin-insensitive murein endopeptidase [unclassified Motilimonas]MCE0555440.1 penicillin-insensitive murein endopeptidase [Motilimonas sp. E26]MDO6527958.1 penicillin-insensitive murein endopeptidase [Motilimonas sp. 1_MG-2023]